MKAANSILEWVYRNGIGQALAAGFVAAGIVAAVVLSQPTRYRAEIRILSAGKLSADEAQALAVTQAVAAAAVSLPALSGYNLAAADFFRGTDTEQLLQTDLALPATGLELGVTDTDPNRAASRTLAWAQALCAAAADGTAEMGGGCYDPNFAPPAQVDNHLWWKLLTAALLGSLLGYGGWSGKNRWSNLGRT